MPAVAFPRRATPRNAPYNNRWLAQEFLNRPNSIINARQPAHNERCGCCNRKPPSDELCEVVLDMNSNLTARIGIGRCHFSFFRSALEDLLIAERAGTHPNKLARIMKLTNAIAALPRKLP
jgi:hypothetical protein